MGFEVELKFRVPSLDQITETLDSQGVTLSPGLDQVDLYFAHPSRDFAQTDEALRLRCNGEENRVTYKAPKKAGTTKTREEIEITFASGADRLAEMSTLLERLGFQPVCHVRKCRRETTVFWSSRTMHLAIDDAGQLGLFAEVEAIAHDESDLAAAQAAVLGLAAQLGLSDVEPRSYLRMTLETAGVKNPT